MEIAPPDQKAILQLIESGVKRSSAKLAAVSRAEWQVCTTSLKAYSKPEDYAELHQPSQYFFGAHCRAPGKMFLALFNSRSAALITKAYLAGSGKGYDATPQMQETVIAEVANIVINDAAGSLADRCGMAFILSAPKTVRGSRSDIVTAAFGEFSPAGKVFSVWVQLVSKEMTADCALMLMLDDLILNYILNALDR